MTSQQNPYMSICEINHFGHVPLNKIVVGKCTCDVCVFTKASLAICKGSPLPNLESFNAFYYVSPETLSQSFAEVKLKDALGGISVWKLNPQIVDDNNWFEFCLSLKEHRDRSAFYYDGKNTTPDVPRYVVYVENWTSENLEICSNVFSQASLAGVNYLVFDFYNAYEYLTGILFS